jgi:hypothetical protein
MACRTTYSPAESAANRSAKPTAHYAANPVACRTTYSLAKSAANRSAKPTAHHSVHPTAARTAHRTVGRTAAAAATLAALLAILLTSLVIPAQAATHGTDTTTAIATQQTHHPVASRPGSPAGALTVGGLCLAGIVATAAGVLWYTARTRRTLDSDPS